MDEEKDNINPIMQQKFNFESNSFDEEDTRTYKIKKRQNAIRSEREKELIILKNKYKKKSSILSFTCFVFLFSCIMVILMFVFIKPKEVIKEVNVMDENIVFLGDSITERYDLDEYYSKYHVVNSGMSGDATEDILNNLETRVYIYNPTKVFLLIGTNDIEREKSVEYIYNNITKIITKIKKNRPKAKIYLESIYPINNGDDEKINMETVDIRENDKINKINNKLKNYCKEHNITFININKVLLDEDNMLNLEYTLDGLHISDKGYSEITKKILPYLDK